ncbi:MAG TPA: ATP-binding protein [Streptosporangiaceae bacterium]|nr:ATP-binding protein [Streptosporangiaceae bacterium]
MRTLRERLEATRRKTFIGREMERGLFAAALAGEESAFSVLYVHGPGGIGKSTLLHRLADDARTAGRTVVELDGRLTEASPHAFESAVGIQVPGMVLLIDTFERCQGLETWLSHQFLPKLPWDAIVVIASRLPPDPSWRADPAWADALRVITLRNLNPDESAVLMRNRGVASHLQPKLLAFAGGHPLALTLAAEVATNDQSEVESWEPGQDVVRTLLNHLVGELPSELHRRTLAVCAHVEVTTEELLRTVVPAHQATALFEWLRGLPFVEAGPRGVYPHDIARNALEADLSWRDPEGYAAIHHAVRPYLLQRMQSSSPADALRSAREFLFILRRSPVISAFFSWWHSGDLFGDRYQPADRRQLLVLAEQAEGPELAGIVAYWLDRMPEAFQICRRISTGQPAGFSAWLRLAEPDDEDRLADPVVDAAWTHVTAEAALRPGEYLGLSRFWVDPERYEQSSPVMDLMLFRNARAWLAGDGLAWSFCVTANPERWQDNFAGIQHHLIPATSRIGSTDFGLFARDWRRTPLEPWLDQLTAQALSGDVGATSPDPAEYPVLSRSEFDDAVRAALRSLHSESLSASVLVRSRIVAGNPDADRTRGLRDLLVDTIRSMSEDPRAAKLYRVLDATFLHAAPTQEVAANSLGLPFTTYRRHLTRGIQLVCDRLWRRELGTELDCRLGTRT